MILNIDYKYIIQQFMLDKTNEIHKKSKMTEYYLIIGKDN